MRIVFICESSLDIGTGHVMRCITLANAFRLFDYDILFATSKTSTNLIDKLNNFKIIDPQIFINNPIQSDLIVIDNYQVDYIFEEQIRKHTNKILVIDDLFNRKHNCDILLDQNLGVKKSFYKNLVNKNCKILVGTKYALLRPEFLEFRKLMFRKRKSTKEITKILVNFGGSDLNNYCLKVLKMIEESNFKGEVNVILGFKAIHLNEIKEFANNSKNKIIIHHQADMAQMIFDADIGIGAGGSSTWERCCLGLPTYLFKIADNQEFIFKKLGQNISFNEFLLDANNNYYKLVKKISKLVDGKGVDRITKLIRNF